MEENKDEVKEETTDIIDSSETPEVETLEVTGAVLSEPIVEPTVEPVQEPAIEAPVEPVVEEPVPEPAQEPAPEEVAAAEQTVEPTAEPVPAAEAPAEPAPEPVPVPVEEKKEEKKKGNKAVIIITIILLLAVAGFAVWFFVLRGDNGGKKEDDTTTTTTTTSKTKASPYRLSGNGLEEFDLQFLRVEDVKENAIYSPLSIKYALAMLNEGTAGESNEQIKALIGDYKGKKYTNSENLAVSNAFFVREEYKQNVKEAFIEVLKNKYDAEIIADSFKDPYTINSWVKSKTLELIDNIIDQIADEEVFFIVNALGIDMEWKNNFVKIGKGYNYSESYEHMNFGWGLRGGGSPSVVGDEFEGVKEKVAVMDVKASFNNYDIVKEKGEEKYKASIKDWYKTCMAESGENYTDESIENLTNNTLEAIKKNYGKTAASTDFSVYVDDDVKVFAKDLKEYDGVTLQYVGVMPINQNLNAFVKKLTAKDLQAYINKLKDLKKENFEDGYITYITGYIPKFKYDYSLDLEKDLKTLGVTDIFDASKANLSKISDDKLVISRALHKANIDFSQYGIKAAAATAMGGAGNASGGCNYVEKDLKIKEIDITFNKPYLYIIRDKESGEVWFTGEVYEPSPWATDPDNHNIG